MPSRQRPHDPRYYNDSQVRPAATSPREAAQQKTNKKSSGGGLMSKLHLPSLFSTSSRDEQQASETPMPYGPNQNQSRSSRPQGSQGTSKNGSMTSGQANRSNSQPSRNGRQTTMAPARSSTGVPSRQPAAAHDASPAPLVASRVERSSPPANTRRNELAEALSGLGSSKDTDASAQSEKQDVTPPSIDNVEELPSYLQESKSATTNRVVQKPRDLRDALLSEDAVEELQPAPAGKVAAKASTPSASSKAVAAKPITKPVSSKGSTAKPAVKELAPSAEALGSLDAKDANSAFGVEARPAEAGSPAANKPSKSSAAIGSSTTGVRGLSFTSKQPQITSNIEGPQRIVVGRQAEYRVTIENKGEVAARNLTAAIAAPAGTEVVDASASNGTVDRGAANPAGAGASEIKWELYELPAGASQTLTLQLIPRSGREMQLGIELTHAPVVSQATVEIQEPKLQMEIAGPAEVLFGKSQRYALTLSNPGNGAAEDVSIELTPPGGNKDSMVRHKVGTLAAGESKKIELELTAREAGDLKIQAVAMATGDLRTESVKTVLCRKAELQVDWRGPEKKYAGAVATYYIRVKNPGTASADQVVVQCSLPAGTELVQASDGNAFDVDHRTLVWKAGSLNAGEERFMQVQCRMSQPGVNKMEVSAQAAGGDLSDAKSVAVNVEAIADLKLDVSDPKGVVPVGEEAIYEIHIKNRGATPAHGVNIVAMFSDGIDPAHVEGGQHTIRDGRVTFRTIDNLPAGGETVFKIHAKATKSGTHVFRTEVACDELEAKLAAEETTRFFTDDQRWADASTAYADEAQGAKTR